MVTTTMKISIASRAFLVLTLALFASACRSNGPLVFNLMPAPSAFTDTGIDIYQVNEDDPEKTVEPMAIFYATDREPAKPGNKKNPHYVSHRGDCVRIGRATIGPDKETTWDNIRSLSFSKDRPGEVPIKVDQVKEYGVLASSIHNFTPTTDEEVHNAEAAEKRYVREINDHLKKSRTNSINIYIHGYKVTFENPILTSTELWHFLGNDGVFIAYSWPSTPNALAYFSDTETAQFSARNLRELIRFLGEETDATTINLIAYSAGTRVLSRALADLALQEGDRSPEEIRKRLKLGTVILLAGDADIDIIGGYLNDGIDKISDQLIFYQSNSDKALWFSRFLAKYNRIGQAMEPDDLSPQGIAYLNARPNVAIIDVSNADAAQDGNGHGYLRGSPWVSSDLLVALAFGLPTEERGLIQKSQGIPLWTFPTDYIDRLRNALLKQSALKPGSL